MNDQDILNAFHKMELTITGQLVEHNEKLTQNSKKLDTIFEKIDGMERTIYGKGGSKDGLATRVMVLEETEESHKYTPRTLFVGVTGIIGKVLYDIFGSH